MSDETPIVDLDVTPDLPPFRVKLNDQLYEFEALALAYSLKDLSGETNPSVIGETISAALTKLLGQPLELTTYKACELVVAFENQMQQHMEPLKKVFGSELFSTTTSESLEPNTTI